jgi:uncharacterized protein involved in outer membrane biogenesis
MRITRKSVLISSLSVIVLLALLFLALPPLARHLAVQKIGEATGRKAEIAGISCNPFTLSAGITGFRLSEKGASGTFLSFSSARLSLSPLSLPKRSFIVTEIKIVSPYLHVVRTAPNRFNFSDLLTGKKEPKQQSYLFSLNNITLSHGSLDFQDKALRFERDHQVSNLALLVPFFSNMPYLADRYVTPHFSAVVNGTPVALNGRLKPLTRAVEASIDLKVQALDLPFYLGYLPFPLPVKVESGRLTTALELGYRVDERIGPEASLAGSLALDRIALLELGGAPLARLNRAELKIKRAALTTRQLDLRSLELEGVELFAARDAAGRWNFQKIEAGPRSQAPKEEKAAAGRKAPAPTTKTPAPASKPLSLKLAKFSLSGGKIHLADATPKGGFRSELDDITLTLSDLSTAPGQRAPFSLKLATARGEKVALKGDLVPEPLEIRANLALTGIPLKDYYPYLSDTLTAPVAGTLGIDSEILYSGSKGLVLEKTALKVANLAAPFGAGEGVRLKEALISGISVGLNEKKAQVESVELKGGSIILSREAGGALSAQHLLRPAKGPAAPGAKGQGKAAAKRTKAPAPFSYRIGKVAGSELGIRITDRTMEEAPVFSLSHLKFSLAGIAGPRQGPIPFTLASGYGNKGRITAGGNLTPAPLRLKGNLTLHGISLRDFDAYIPEGTAIFLADGALDTNLALNLEQAASGLKGSFSGSLGVRSFYCQETVYNQDLLKWESLQLETIRGTLGPFTLGIKDVSLSNFYARVIVEPDGTLNLQHLTSVQQQAPAAAAAQKPGPAPGTARPALGTPAAPQGGTGTPAASQARTAPQAASQAASQAAPQAGTAATTAQKAGAGTPAPSRARTKAPTAPTGKAAPAPATGAPPAQAYPIRIGTVTMQGGTLDFSDHHLKTPFDTTFFNLGGRVSGLSSEVSRAADVDLRGNLENHSPLAITGLINPLRGDLFLDLKIAFTDIELSPFTPYANTYLGYAIDKGKLNLDLTYKIDKKALTSQNKIFLDQFTFGKQVESDKATKLPVRLAIALLKDRKGEIHLNLPVVGQTDDPKFSVWGVVLQILKNLLVKAATSPFALLGSLFGGGEDFSAIPFAPGSDQLSKPDEEKLMKLAQMLHDRPALNLEISGFVDRDKDAEGYRNELLLKKMRGEKFRALVKQGKNREGQTQENTELLPQEESVYLKAVYAKEKFSKPRNVVGIAKDLPDAEMRKLIITHTVVGDNELQALARERAQAVRDFLLKNGKLPAERLFEKSADIFRANSKEGISPSRVEFGAIVK